ncbi:uncharacterized protein LOC17881468 [Capsella rubella]|uniref:uncharacterized protein LOC17881468 n=1 Tax=Capsella rubella TaxID=81985 RepID=UPI000CD5881E|nr:uncharacterized protein LOC17881468 [Capsella rubella]
MAEHREPNLDDDGSKSYFRRTVVLRDWWLVKCPVEFEGKRFGVAGIEDSLESRAVRVFTSSPIIKALDVFTLLSSDGIYITLRGFLNKERVVKNGFTPEISREFVFGFPPCWERIVTNCSGGGASLGTDTSTVPSTVARACYPILSPCKNNKQNIEDSSAEGRDESIVPDMNMGHMAEIINTKDVSRAKDRNTARRKSLHLQTKSGGKNAEQEKILESSKVRNTTSDGDHGMEELHKGKTGDVEKDECETINNEDEERELDESKLQNLTTIDGDLGSEGLDKAKSGDVEQDYCEAIDNGVISSADGCGKNQTGADNVVRVTSTSITGASLTSEQQKGELRDVCEAINNRDDKRKLEESKLQNPTTNDGDDGSEGLDKAKSCDVEKDESEAVNNGVISLADGCGRKRTDADNVDKVTSTSATGESLTSEQQKTEHEVTAASPHSLFQDLDKSSKPGKRGKSKKKSRKTLKNTGNVVEPSNCLEAKVKSAENKRKLQNLTTNDKDRGKKGLNNAKSNDVERDDCVAINEEVISPVDGCARRHPGTNRVGKLISKKATKESLTSEQRKGRVKETKTSLRSLSKDLNNSSKPAKKGNSKKSEKTLKRDLHAAEENFACESEENLSWGNTKRKIDFDVEVTPENKVKKQKTKAVYTDSLGQKRSRSGRVLVSPLEFWRNQIPVYDMDRNLIQVKDGHDSSQGKGSKSRKPRS